MDKFTQLLARTVSVKAYSTTSNAVYLRVTKLDGCRFTTKGVNLEAASQCALTHLTRICQ